MKNNGLKLVLALCMTIFFVACDKEDGPVLTPVEAADLNSPTDGSSIALSFVAGAPQNVVAFEFDRAVYDPVVSVDYQVYGKFVNRFGRDTVIYISSSPVNIPTVLPSVINIYHRDLNSRLCGVRGNTGPVVRGAVVDVDFFIKSYARTRHTSDDIILENPGTIDGEAVTVTVDTYL